MSVFLLWFTAAVGHEPTECVSISNGIAICTWSCVSCFLTASNSLFEDVSPQKGD